VVDGCGQYPVTVGECGQHLLAWQVPFDPATLYEHGAFLPRLFREVSLRRDQTSDRACGRQRIEVRLEHRWFVIPSHHLAAHGARRLEVALVDYLGASIVKPLENRVAPIPLLPSRVPGIEVRNVSLLCLEDESQVAERLHCRIQVGGECI
jgi:hypothetical protein